MKLKKFHIEKFNAAVILSIVSITVLIIIFGLLTVNSQPHVRFVEIDGGQDNAYITNQRIKVYFSNPMKKDVVTDFISVSPEREFTTAWSNNTLFIIFKTSLNSLTDYKVVIDKSMTDIYDKPLGSDFTYSFKTEDLKLAYVKDAEDSEQIVLANPTLENPQVLFAAPSIKLFALNKDHLAVVTTNEGDDTDNLIYVNLKDGSSKDFHIESSIISKIDFSTISNQFIYLSQKVEKKTGYNQPSDQIHINLYSIDEDKHTILNYENSDLQPMDMKYGPDAASVLVKIWDGSYIMMPINDLTKLTVLGRFLSVGNFNKDGNKVIFVGFDPLTTYTQAQYLVEYKSDHTEEILTSGNKPVLDPEYFHREDSILFAERLKELNLTKGIFRIVKLDETGGEFSIIEDNERSLELPRISPDDRYVVIERYAQANLLDYEDQRNFLFQTKPGKADLIIFDLQANILIDKNVQGTDAQWVN